MAWQTVCVVMAFTTLTFPTPKPVALHAHQDPPHQAGVVNFTTVGVRLVFTESTMGSLYHALNAPLVFTQTEPHALNAPQAQLHKSGVPARQDVCRLCVMLVFTKGGTTEPHALHAPQASLPKTEKIVYFNAPQAPLYICRHRRVAWQTVCVILVFTETESNALNAPQAPLHKCSMPIGVIVIVMLVFTGLFTGGAALHVPQASLHYSGVLPLITVCVLLVFTRVRTYVFRVWGGCKAALNAPQASLLQSGVIARHSVRHHAGGF